MAVTILLLASAGLSACSSAPDGPSPGASASRRALHPLPTAADAKHAWAVGIHGAIVATTDGGRHWHAQTSGTSYWLNDVSFADADHGWAVGCWNGERGEAAPVLATKDGGKHWQRQLVAEHFQARAVACADASHAWVGGNDGSDGPLIAATSDGGAHWTTQLRWSSGASQIFALAFADSLHGWAIADYETLLATCDGGAHWCKQSLPKGHMSINCIACLDASLCYVGGSCTRGSNVLYPWLAETTDGGETWRSLPVASIGSDPLGSLAAMSRTWMLVGSYDRAWSTTDQCAHLTRLPMPSITSFAFADSNRGWCIAGHSIWATVDGGHTWHEQDAGIGDISLTAVACGAPQRCSGPCEP